MNRRGFIGVLAGAIAAPTLARAGLLMPIKPSLVPAGKYYYEIREVPFVKPVPGKIYTAITTGVLGNPSNRFVGEDGIEVRLDLTDFAFGLTEQHPICCAQQLRFDSIHDERIIEHWHKIR